MSDNSNFNPDFNPEDLNREDLSGRDLNREDPGAEEFAAEDFTAETFDPELVVMLSEISTGDRDRLVPPPSIWNAIADTITADRSGQPNRELTLIEDDGAVLADISPIEQRATTTISLNRTTVAEVDPGPNSAWRQWLPVAAAIGVAVAGGLVTWAFSDRIVDGRVEGELVASTEIINDGLPVPNETTGQARLTEVDGQFRLELDVPDLPDVDGFYEVWITDTNVEGMFSLGVVTGDATFTLPPNVDPGDFPVVDVSVEPIDGDPTHSGQSIWRGVLDT